MAITLSKTEPAPNTLHDATNYTIQLTDGTRRKYSASLAREWVARGAALYVIGIEGETI
jgi:hypothetical protein